MANNRHAYLILVHNQPRLLQVLIDMIDDERNDIYIHVDDKADFNLFNNIHAKKSKISYTKRIKIYWGTFSMVKAEYILFEAAKKYGPYLYYHLLSGVDLPLKNQDFIHHLLDEVYKGEELVGFSNHTLISQRYRYYHLFGKQLRSNTSVAKRYSKIKDYLIALQKRVGIWRNKNVAIMFGPQWVSITDDLCQYILTSKKRTSKIFRMTIIPDESFIQTLVHGSCFEGRVYDRANDYKSCMRLIDWDKGPDYPHIWTCQDWEELVSSDRLFARKFSEDDMDFVYQLKNHVLNSKHDYER